MENITKKICPKHGLTEFYYDTYHNIYKCKECRKEAVLDKRRRNKIALVEYKGGKCEICGYHKCIDALEFHHINKDEKSFGIGNGDTRSLEKLKKEADKCILVCSNCHKEIHAQIREEERNRKIEEMQQNISIFKKIQKDNGKHIYSIPNDLDIEIINNLISEGNTNSEIAKQLNFSLTTLKRFLSKHNIINSNNSHKMNGYNIEMLKKDMMECGNFTAIGRKRGISFFALKKWCSRNNLPIRLDELKKYLGIEDIKEYTENNKNITKYELIKLLSKYSFVEIGKLYGVSDNAVRKWCKKYGLPYRRRDVTEFLKENHIVDTRKKWML